MLLAATPAAWQPRPAARRGRPRGTARQLCERRWLRDASSVPLLCHLFVLLTEEKWKCFPPDGMLSRGLLLACVGCVRCKLNFLYQLGILWNLLPFDGVSRWEGATACFCTVQFSFTLTGFEFGEGVCCLVSVARRQMLFPLDYLEAFSHPAGLF